MLQVVLQVVPHAVAQGGLVVTAELLAELLVHLRQLEALVRADRQLVVGFLAGQLRLVEVLRQGAGAGNGVLDLLADEVVVREVRSVKEAENGGYAIDAVWTVGGSVNHFGHLHFRQNRYDATITIVPIEDTWKIRSMELLQETREL